MSVSVMEGDKVGTNFYGGVLLVLGVEQCCDANVSNYQNGAEVR